MMSKDAWDFTMIFFVMWFSVCLFLWGIWAGAEAQCQDYGELTGYEVTMLNGCGCMANHPDKGWISAWRR